MKSKRISHLLFFMMSAVLLTTISCSTGKVKKLMLTAKTTFGQIPDAMPGAEKDTPELIELGKELYFETGMSINDKQSCNTCHRVDEGLGGVDNNPTSPGAEGKFGDRNSPTTLNAGFQIAQFWDGRAADLVEQAKGPTLNPIEMGMPSEAFVIDKLTKITKYDDMFKKAFPGTENPLTYHNIAVAIAAFERTLITRDRFDDFIGGDDKALTEDEITGLEHFINNKCSACHDGFLLGGQQYTKVGVVNPYPNTEDHGRYDVTKKEADKYVFKVPMLRNIEVTYPYYHDGKVETLEKAVETMFFYQAGKEPEKDVIVKITDFLKSLTGKKLKKS